MSFMKKNKKNKENKENKENSPREKNVNASAIDYHWYYESDNLKRWRFKTK